MTNATASTGYAVEGHGDAILKIRGNDRTADRWTREAKLPRAKAWEAAKEMMRRGDVFHTVYVKPHAYADASDAVFSAHHTPEGWRNAKTGELISL